jgi:hypothetical protein
MRFRVEDGDGRSLWSKLPFTMAIRSSLESNVPAGAAGGEADQNFKDFLAALESSSGEAKGTNMQSVREGRTAGQSCGTVGTVGTLVLLSAFVLISAPGIVEGYRKLAKELEAIKEKLTPPTREAELKKLRIWLEDKRVAEKMWRKKLQELGDDDGSYNRERILLAELLKQTEQERKEIEDQINLLTSSVKR